MNIEQIINAAVAQILEYSNSTGEQDSLFYKALQNPEQYADFLKAVSETLKEVRIEEYNGEYLLVPKNYVMTTKELEEWLISNDLHQNKKDCKWGCRIWSEIYGMALLSEKAQSSIAPKKGRIGKAPYAFNLGCDTQYQNVESTDNAEDVFSATVAGILTGSPSVLQVNQTDPKKSGERHEVTAFALRADSVFNAFDETGNIDYSKLEEKDIYIIDPAYRPEHGSIGSMEQFGRYIKKQNGVYQTAIANTELLEENQYLDGYQEDDNETFMEAYDKIFKAV